MTIQEFIYPTQKELFKKIKSMYHNPLVEVGSYILVRGKAPIMLVAHMDTVHEVPVTDICATEDGNILMSPQGIGGDDRCGVYALASVYQKSKVKPWLLFTCDEEVGGIGASTFAAAYTAGLLPEGLKEIKCIVEIDRKGSCDAVYYDCGNNEFEDYITGKGFKTNFGSFSDISVIAPTMGVAAVNLSSGYYNAHTLHEFICLAELEETIRKVISIVEDSTKDMQKYEYVEAFDDWYLNDWKSYRKLYKDVLDEKNFKSLEIENMYYELLEFYTEEELDEIIDLNGEAAIKWLYEGELGLDEEGAV